MSTEAVRLYQPETATGDEQELLEFLEANGCRITYVHEKGGLVECYVPTELIDHEDVAVTDDYASSLAAQMQDLAKSEEGSGQQTPIGLALIPGQHLLKISDGFHRDAALKINGEPEVYATVKMTTWDGLYDQRIYDSKKHPNLRFSRVVQWMREIWNITGLGNYGMSLEQAILIYRFDTDGSKLGFTPEQVGLAKEWVGQKEAKWDITAMTIHSHLKIAEHVDPKLVQATRVKARGDVLTAPTQAILKIFAEYVPDNFEFQNMVMSAAMAHNLKGPYVHAACEKIKDCGTVDEAREIIATIDWQNLEPVYENSANKALRRAFDPRIKGSKVLDKAASEINGVISRADLITIRGEEIRGRNEGKNSRSYSAGRRTNA
ncbi:ParB N-terminal domain-containing protein [Candidatus Saccharibacteria bacterium]|nr:ParB N-terminal domain-containing protein [Candidatus Saccharibacteria bacterium]